ncbi:MAG: hypothetical protein JJT89_02015 [Nitriliruptoraceae bacterium]|nr:hypothetical protein [Nitriliruptoraceae bacterium]
MNDDFRSRVIMPIVLPIAVLATIAAFVGTVALTLLYNTNGGALALAAAAAGGILFTVSLATSQDRLELPQRGVVIFAASLPILVGAGFAAGIIGDIDDDARMANVQPLITIPEDAPVIAAENSVEYCFFEDGECGDVVDVWEVVPSAESDLVSFRFENLDPTGTQHNVAILELEGSVDDPQPGGSLGIASSLIPGGESDGYQDESITWDELPEEWYFVCSLHATMNGVGRVVEES